MGKHIFQRFFILKFNTIYIKIYMYLRKYIHKYVSVGIIYLFNIIKSVGAKKYTNNATITATMRVINMRVDKQIILYKK